VGGGGGGGGGKKLAFFWGLKYKLELLIKPFVFQAR
jgi:hypothetical protein